MSDLPLLTKPWRRIVRTLLGVLTMLGFVAASCVTIDVPLYPDASPPDRPPCTGNNCPPPDEPPEKECPSSCQSHKECKPCGGDYVCNNGVCHKPLKCAPTCANDGDCAGCADQKTACIKGLCDKKPPPRCLNECKGDADCTGCPDDRTDCVKDPFGVGRCIPNGGSLCPDTCDTHARCTNCDRGRTHCRPPTPPDTLGVCVPPPPRCGVLCFSDRDCGRCKDARFTDCVQRRCIGRRCLKHGDCPPKSLCAQGRCVPY